MSFLVEKLFEKMIRKSEKIEQWKEFRSVSVVKQKVSTKKLKKVEIWKVNLIYHNI